MTIERALIAIIAGLVLWFLIKDSELGSALRDGFDNVCTIRLDS